MNTSQFLNRHADTVECWDDDPDFAGLDIAHPTPIVSSPRAPTDHRDHRDRRESVSSRMSLTSNGYDFDSPDGDHEQQVLLDESPSAAIASAINAGIPIPENVPSSALVGGTIKRLGTTKKGRRVAAQDDWSDDLELPKSGVALRIQRFEHHPSFPESLHHASSGFRSRGNSPSRSNLMAVQAASSQLNKFREDAENDDFFADSDELPALKLPPLRQNTLQPIGSNRSLLLTPPLSEATRGGSPSVGGGDDDDDDDDFDFEKDFEFPADAPLQLNINKSTTEQQHRAPVVHGLDPDFEEWAETSYVGSRNRREGGMGMGMGMGGDARRTNSVSMLSPSVSSVTAESEDESPLDGLELPEGRLPDFHALLERRKLDPTLMDISMDDFHAQQENDAREEFFEGIEIGDGEVFDARKLTLNRNVKHKSSVRRSSPVRRTAMSLTFTTNKPTTTTTTTTPTTAGTTNTSTTNNPIPGSIGGRGNRLAHGHPTLLPPIPILESVAEKENPQHTNSTATKRPENRTRWSSGHQSDQRWSGATGPQAFGMHHIPPPPPIPQSNTSGPRSRHLAGKPSMRRGPNQQENTPPPPPPPPTTTSAQLLRMKRSMPNIGRVAVNSPQKQPRPPSRSSAGRPPSRSSQGRPTSSGSRPPSSGGRPPSRSSTGRPSSRNETMAAQGTSRPNEREPFSTSRKPAPFLPGGSSVQSSHHISAKLNRDSYQSATVASERRSNSRLQGRNTPRHSPSSSTSVRRTSPRVAPESLRREAAAIGTLTAPTRKRNFGDGTELETFDDLPTSAKLENRFVVTPVARGAPKAMRPKSMPVPPTNSVYNITPPGESPMKKADLRAGYGEVPRFARDTNASRNAREQRMGLQTPVQNTTPGANHWRTQVAARNTTPKPRSGTTKKPQQKPHLIKPLGNVSVVPRSSPQNGMTYNPRTFRWEGNEASSPFDRLPTATPPRPALIANVSASGAKLGIQVVGGMVFDPSRMCWLKVDEDPDGEDEDDIFEGVEDLMDHDLNSSIDGCAPGLVTGGDVMKGGCARLSGGFGEFVVGEEFDVGPAFVGRQREEEDRWRRRCDGWFSGGRLPGGGDKWALRQMLGVGG